VLKSIFFTFYTKGKIAKVFCVFFNIIALFLMLLRLKLILSFVKISSTLKIPKFDEF